MATRPCPTRGRQSQSGLCMLLLAFSFLANCLYLELKSFAQSFPTPNLSKRTRSTSGGGSSSTRLPFFLSDPMGEGEFLEISGEEDDDEYCSVMDEFGCEAFENFFEDESGTDFRWIRIEKEPDPSLSRIETRDDVLQAIDDVKREQGKYGQCELYPRRWHYVENDEDFRVNGEALNGLSAQEFTVMQFNALAEGLSAGPSFKRPFKIDPDDKHTQNEKNDYGGFTSIPFKNATLDFALRRWRILEVILTSYQSSLFDLIAMEEIDRYRGFFSPLLRLFGYEGLFVPKTRSPGVRMGWYSDGCAFFWRKEVFALESERRRQFKVGNQVYSIVVLRHLATNRLVVAAVSHLKAQRNETNERIRTSQVEEIMEEISATVTELMGRGECHVGALLMGDFNADPPSAREGGQGSVDKVLRFHLPSSDGSELPFKSAYKIDPPDDSFYTTWKVRGSDTARRIIDYIFFSGQLECKAVLGVPQEGELEEAKLPGLRYPSDHMMIAARFRLN